MPDSDIGSPASNRRDRFETYGDFWPYYLQEHADKTCRQLHYVGTSLTFLALAAGILVSPWWLIAAPMAGYGFAWFAHFKYERNKPATFKYPLWSLFSDYRMYFNWLGGKLGPHLKDAGVSS